MLKTLESAIDIMAWSYTEKNYDECLGNLLNKIHLAGMTFNNINHSTVRKNLGAVGVLFYQLMVLNLLKTK